MYSSDDYSNISKAYEEHLANEWERYNEEGNSEEEDYDPYAEAEARWEMYDER